MNKEELYSAVHKMYLQRNTQKEIMRALGITAYRVRKIYAEMGVIRNIPKRIWTNKEISILDENCNLSLVTIQNRLRGDGFHRTLSAIQKKLLELNLSSSYERGFTIGQLTRILGHHRITINKWISSGKLKAKKEIGYRQTDIKEPDFWSVNDDDLALFLIRHPMDWEMRRIPFASQQWVINLIAGDVRDITEFRRIRRVEEKVEESA